MLQSFPTIGEYKTSEDIIAKLEELEEPEAIAFTKTQNQSKDLENFLNFVGGVKNQPWYPATHQYGYIAPRQPGSSKPQPILHPSAIEADPTLKNSRINIRLDRLRVYKYPGGGTHNVMVTFEAQNQVGNVQEAVSFSQTYRVPEGNSAGIAGYAIFLGLNVGSEGIKFKGVTINVKNEEDEAVLEALESSTFQNGLKLLTTAQPAIAPFTAISLGLVKLLAKRNRNVAVQKFDLGLDFDSAALAIRLAEGNYIAVQVPHETAIDWNKWVYKPDLGAIVHKADDSLLEYNYLVFRVSRYQDN
ncbi:hypothetical protein C7B64_01745 [Merismopedia glauca CCAP 1448/3]|uniref:Uncharacterized protein n=1 Tax=Merismopedia glauca CCAP 1448/3 TaxID=1296344 RepID=A0A2T1C9R6_9CYAN|nr:hypothetical protein C7B64_01745 [Merismopedia glauca CCAP 1448/3]